MKLNQLEVSNNAELSNLGKQLDFLIGQSELDIPDGYEIVVVKKETPIDISTRRLSYYPINPRFYPIHEQWETHSAAYWTPFEVDFSEDRKDWKSITEIERKMLGGVLAFFSGGDTIINGNIAKFAEMVPDDYLEIKLYWSDQQAREGIHQVTYGQTIEALCSPDEREMFQNAILNWKSVRDMSNFMSVTELTVSDDIRLQTSVIINICSEGIFFSAAFSFIFWFKSRGLFPGVTFSNEKISLDEANHATTAVIFYIIEYIKQNNGLPKQIVYSYFEKAVELAIEFVNDFVPEDFNLDGTFNRKLAIQYIKYVADYFLVALGYDKLYKCENPLSFMNLISLQGKTNFFEKRVGEYNKADVTGWKEAKIDVDLVF